jgi:hypothetical protein
MPLYCAGPWRFWWFCTTVFLGKGVHFGEACSSDLTSTA